MKTLGNIKMNPIVVAGYEAVCCMLMNVIPDLPPACLVPYSMAAMGAALAKIPDETWKEAESTVGIPCGREGCTCETLRMKFFPMLNEIREFGKNDMQRMADEVDDQQAGTQSFPS